MDACGDGGREREVEIEAVMVGRGLGVCRLLPCMCVTSGPRPKVITRVEAYTIDRQTYRYPGIEEVVYHVVITLYHLICKLCEFRSCVCVCSFHYS